MRKKPNILWLMSDQHNANCLGAAGHPDVRTPHLDRIARRGVRFERAYCNNPISGPSRACFLSGQYVKTHGITGNFIRDLRSEAPNLARRFRTHGYETAFVGKAHLPYHWVEEGFETIRLCDLTDAEKDNPESCHYFHDLVEAGLADQYDQGLLPEGHPGFGNRVFASELPEEFSLEAWTGRQAVAFLNQRDKERPFFLKVSFQRPHDPYSPPASRMNDYDPNLLHLPENACDYLDRGFSGKPQFQQEYVAGQKGQGYPFLSSTPSELKEQMAAHFTLITMIDEQIGTLLQTLEAQGELENTIIAYVADHGDFAGEHGLVLKNLGIYESIHRIPFLLAGPGITQGAIRDALIESVDLYPTLAELAGIPCETGVDGVSRVPEITTGKGGCSQVVCEHETPPHSVIHAVRDENFRLVYYDDFPGDGELYDHRTDPGELDNLFHDPAFRDTRDDLVTTLKRFRENARRIHTREDDVHQLAESKHLPSVRLHKYGATWSEVRGDCRKNQGRE